MPYKNLENNISKIYAIKFFGLFLVLMPVIVPFFQQSGLGMKGVYLLQSVFAVTVFIFEIPSGYISDLLGRKKTLLVSFTLKGIGFSLFPLAQNIETFIIAEIILGIAISLNSGTDTALIYDTLEVISPNKAHIKVLGKSLSYQTLGEGFASLIASILMLFSFSISSLAVVSAGTSWIALLIAFFLVEPPRQKMSKEHKENFKYIFKSLFKESRLLNLIILNSIFSFCGTLFAVWLFQKYWNNLSIPLVYFGFLWAITNFSASLASRYAHKLEKLWGSSNVIIIVGLLPVAGYFGISYIDHFIGVLACLLFQTCRGIGQVILKDALNKRVSADFRATANSITQMGVRLLFTVIGPLIGFFVDTKGLSKATELMGVFYIGIFFFAVIPLIKERKNFISVH